MVEDWKKNTRQSPYLKAVSKILSLFVMLLKHSFLLSHFEMSYVHSPKSNVVDRRQLRLQGDVPISPGLQAPDHAALVHFHNRD